MSKKNAEVKVEVVATQEDTKVAEMALAIESEELVEQEIVIPEEKKVKEVIASNTMYPAIVAAHNANNTRAITEKNCEDLGIGKDHLDQFIKECNELRKAVVAYVVAKHDHKMEFKDKEKTALRNKIFPLWKTMLESGEVSCFAKELHVSSFDIDSLVGYGEMFVGSASGTQIAATTEQVFRKNVESLLGCRVAKNSVLSDADRDVLKIFSSATRTISSGEKDMETLVGKIEMFRTMQNGKSEDFRTYLDGEIKKVDVERGVLTKRILDATTALAEVEARANEINNALNKIS